MKRVYITGAEVHICEDEELEANAHSFVATAVSAHPVYPAGTKLRIPRAGTVSFAIEEDQVDKVQAAVDAWKKPLLVAGNDAKTDKKPAKSGNTQGARKVGGK